MERKLNSSTIIAVGLAIGLLGAATIFGIYFSNTKSEQRYVTVRGVAEKDVTADLAVWPIKIRVAGNDLINVGQSLESTRDKVQKFLLSKGVSADEITKQELRVTDRQANEYGGSPKEALRYIVESTTQVRTKNIAKIVEVSQLTNELVAVGVVFTSAGNYESSGPNYIYSALNSIKPEMLASATRSAREAANQFAADSGSKVGSIRRASQGLFTISDRDQPDAGGNEGGQSKLSKPEKRVRVVVSVDYLLEGN